MDSLPKFADWRVLNAPALVCRRATADWGRSAEDRIPLMGCLRGAAAGRPRLLRRRRTGGASLIIADTINALPARKATSIPASSTSPRRAADQAHQAACPHGPGWRQSWYLTNGSALVLTPVLAIAQEITYLSYADGDPRVFIRDIDSNRQESVGEFPG